MKRGVAGEAKAIELGNCAFQAFNVGEEKVE